MGAEAVNEPTQAQGHKESPAGKPAGDLHELRISKMFEDTME